MTANFTAETLQTLAPLAERIVTLDAAARFMGIASRQIEEQSRRSESVAEQFRLVGAAQANLNRAAELRRELRALIVEARAVARSAGKSLPGMDGLRVLADRISR